MTDNAAMESSTTSSDYLILTTTEEIQNASVTSSEISSLTAFISTRLNIDDSIQSEVFNITDVSLKNETELSTLVVSVTDAVIEKATESTTILSTIDLNAIVKDVPESSTISSMFTLLTSSNVPNVNESVLSNINVTANTTQQFLSTVSSVRDDLDTTTLFIYEEHSDDSTVVFGVLIPLVIVIVLVAIFVFYQKYWKKRKSNNRRNERIKVSFSENPVVSGSVIKAPRYSDSDECNTNVFAELPDKKDGFVTIDLSEDNHDIKTNGGVNIQNQEIDNGVNISLERICEKEELQIEDEDTNFNSHRDKITETKTDLFLNTTDDDDHEKHTKDELEEDSLKSSNEENTPL